jgi:hypothetical protein
MVPTFAVPLALISMASFYGGCDDVPPQPSG